MRKKIFILLLLSFVSIINSIGQNDYREGLKRKIASASEDTTKVKMLSNVAMTYVFAHADTAVMYAHRGLQLAQQLKYKYGQAKCMYMLGLALTELGDFPNALNFAFKSLNIYDELQDTLMLTWTNISLMMCYSYQQDYKTALIYGYYAKKLSELSRLDSFPVSMIYTYLASTYEKSNQLDSALSYALKAYELYKQWAGTLQTLGATYSKMGNIDRALTNYRNGIPIALKSGTYVSLIDIYNGMSKLFQSIGKKDSAIYYANKSIMHDGASTYPEGQLRASTQLAALYESQLMTDSTIKYLKLTIALEDSLFNRKKTREAQSFALNEKLHQQELAAQIQEDKNKVRLYSLLGALSVFLLLAVFLYRNTQRKQKVNTVLRMQKEEVQHTLTELKSTQSQLIQSEKMASLGELTAGIAHEIQNPLNFVNNFSEINTELIEDLKTELATGNQQEAISIADDIKDNEQKINHHGKRADAIVKGMLQHSRTSSGKKEPTDINALADEYLRLSYHGLRAKDKSFNAEFKTDFDESIGEIEVMPQDIGRVLLNLYNNAFYAVNEKKKQQDETYKPLVSVSTKKFSNKVEIVVKDNGTGIPQKILVKIYQPFFTTKPTGQGTGLGLSMSYDIIKAHDGEMKVETKEGEGAKFIIKIPTNPS